MKSVSLFHSDLKEVQEDLLQYLKPIASGSDFEKLPHASTLEELFSVLFYNYEWLRNKYCKIEEIENIEPIAGSIFKAWLLRKYCTGKGVDDSIFRVVELHEQRISGVEPTKEQWDSVFGNNATLWACNESEWALLASATEPIWLCARYATREPLSVNSRANMEIASSFILSLITQFNN